MPATTTIKYKKCIKCKKKKLVDEFYKKKSMADRRFSICKPCHIKSVANRVAEKSKDPEWIWRERERSRKKHRRYKADGRRKKWDGVQERSDVVKKRANDAARSIRAGKGKHKHHWSYLKKHWKDIIPLTRIQHNRVHRYTAYDPKRRIHKTFHGRLLDTKATAIKYYKYIFSLKNGMYPKY